MAREERRGGDVVNVVHRIGVVSQRSCRRCAVESDVANEEIAAGARLVVCEFNGNRRDRRRSAVVEVECLPLTGAELRSHDVVARDEIAVDVEGKLRVAGLAAR